VRIARTGNAGARRVEAVLRRPFVRRRPRCRPRQPRRSREERVGQLLRRSCVQTIFHNGYQARKLRIVLWASFLACVGMFYWNWDLAHNFGLAPGEGGVHSPVHERLAWAGAVAGLGLAFGLAMMGYASRYVVRIEREVGCARFWTLTPWGIGTWLHILPLAALGRAVSSRTTEYRPPQRKCVVADGPGRGPSAALHHRPASGTGPQAEH
jgi:hypothetical protein